jgi:hypothetical protein
MADRPTITLDDIQERYAQVVRRLIGPCATGRINTTPRHDGSSHIESRDGGWDYVVTERGSEFERRRTTDPDEVLFWLVADLTWGMALEYEFTHRRAGQDFRRIMFAKRIELLNRVNPQWANRVQEEYDRILVEHPFVDRPE